MRNLKRALSLTLASVMLLGMMVVGSSAASYPDVEDTHNVEAIEVLQAIKVMVGDDNGNFGPDDQVNRSQMAVVMALLLDLDYDYYKGTNPFWDVPSWAEPYVAACYANGIVSGYNATTYGAGDPVTAVQAASMMMRALGYFQHQTDYRDGFELSTVKQASKISLFQDVNAAGNNAALTRNQVAQLALNTLKTPMVEGKDNTLNINTGANAGNISITGGSMDYVYVTGDSSKPWTSAINDVQASSMGSTNLGALIELGEKLFNGELELEKNDTDDFGRPSNTWTYKNTKIGTYAHKGELVATYDGKVSKENIYGLLSGTVRSSLESSDNDSGKFRVTVDGWADDSMGGASDANGDPVDLDQSDSGEADPTTWYKKNDSTAIYTYKGRNGNDGDYGSSRKGTLTEVYVDDDKNVDIVIVNTYVYQATSDYSSARDEVRMATVGDTSVQLTANGLTLDGEDFNIENIKEDDYLLVTVAYNGTNYDVKSVDVAQKLQGEVTGYAVGDTVTIDGTKYSYSAICGKSGGTASEAVRSTTYTVGQPAIVVLDKYNNIIAVDEAMAASNFVFVEKVGKDGNMDVVAKAKMFFTDGSKGTFNVDRMDIGDNTYKSADTIAAQNVTNTWFTYSKNSDGNYILYNVPSGYTQANASRHTDNVLLKNGKVDFLAAQGNHLANDGTILIMVDNDGDLSTYTGTQNIPDVKMKAGDATVYYLYDNDDYYVDYAFVNLEDKNVEIIDGGEEDSFLYVLKFANENKGKDNDSVFEYTTIDDETGAEQPSNFDKAIADGDIKDGNGERLNNTAKITRGSKDGVYSLFYKPREKDGEITSVRVVPNDNSKYFNEKVENATVTYAKGSITFSTGDNKYIVNKNSKLTLVALKGTEGVMKDSTKDYQIYASATAADLESILKDKSFKGVLQGCTINETSSVVDTMYVTIDEVNDDVFAGAKVSPKNLEITKGSKVNITINLPKGIGYTTTASATGDTGTVALTGDTAVAVSSVTAAVTKTLTVEGSTNGTATVTVTLKDADDSTAQTIAETIKITVVDIKPAEPPKKPDKEFFGDNSATNMDKMPEQDVVVNSDGSTTVKDPIKQSDIPGTDKPTFDGHPLDEWITEDNGVILRYEAPKGWKNTTRVQFEISGLDNESYGSPIVGTKDGTENGTDYVNFILNFSNSAAGVIKVKVTWTASDGTTTYEHVYPVNVPKTN